MLVKVMALFQSLLYLISSVLFYPVIVALVVLFFWSLFYCGRVLGEMMARRRLGGEAVDPSRCSLSVVGRAREYFVELGRLLEGEKVEEAQVENLLQRWEEILVKDLDRLRVLIRVGPSLGLMGTLIPMGTGLTALSQGNVEKMTSSMIVAFTTTVVGLAIACMAYVLATVKQRWTERDVRLMEFYTELLMGERNEVHEKAQGEWSGGLG